LTIHSVVIHEITKDANVQSATLTKSDKLLDHTHKNVIKMVTDLDTSFKKKSPNRAKFSDAGFTKTIKDFSSYDILEVSQKLAETLQIGIQNVIPAKGGYLLFSEFTINDEYLSVFLIRNTDGTKLTLDGSSWDLDSTEYLNVEHFAMGAKINLTKLNDPTSNERYIRLVRGSTDISKYFENWIGLSDTKQESKDASALYKIANLISLPTDITERDELKKKIFQYAKNSQDNVVNLRRLSDFIYGDEDIISKYSEDNNIDIDGEFRLRGTYLNKFIKVRAKADGITIVAPLENFSTDKIDITSDKTIIIHSEKLVAEIKDALANSN